MDQTLRVYLLSDGLSISSEAAELVGELPHESRSEVAVVVDCQGGVRQAQDLIHGDAARDDPAIPRTLQTPKDLGRDRDREDSELELTCTGQEVQVPRLPILVEDQVSDRTVLELPSRREEHDDPVRTDVLQPVSTDEEHEPLLHEALLHLGIRDGHAHHRE